MSEEIIFEARIFNEKDYYIDDVKVTKELFYKIKNKCEENRQLKEVLDEIRVYINNIPYNELEPIEVQVISKILDKVKE